MFKSFLGKFFCTNTARRRQTRGFVRPVASLESRTLLAGNVTAEIVDGELLITGDDAANDITILKTAAGVIVRGNSTTINGASTDFVAFATAVTTTGKIVSEMGAGDDKVQIDDLTLDGRVVFSGGAGNDKLGLTKAILKSGLGFRGSEGNDSLVLDQSTIDGDLFAFCGAGDDLVSLSNSEVKHSLIMYGRDGADGLNLNNSKVGRWLIEYAGKGDDTVRIANGSTTKHVQLWGQGGADVVQVNESDTSKSFAARMGRGNDAVSLEGDVDVAKRLIVRGGEGTDSFAKGTGTLPGGRIVRTENSTISGTLVSDRTGLGTGGLQNAAAKANADFVESTFVRVATTEGNIDLELFTKDAPITVANFLNYLERYSNSIIHRSVSNFVIQAGGFKPAAIAVDHTIPNEFSSAHSNLQGTLSMALPGDINGGTSQWFINVEDNITEPGSLDTAKHTVFGKVIGNGMTVVNAINAITTFNLNGALDNISMKEVPLKNYTPFTRNLAGTVTVAVGSPTVDGLGTAFNTALKVDDPIQISGVNYIVASITSATRLTLKTNATVAAAGATAKANAAPADASYVKINSVTIIDQP